MAEHLKPPSFISEIKTYAEYKQDLLRWARLSQLQKNLKAEMVIQCLDGHASNIKEKIVTKIGDELIGNDDGIKKLIEFLDTIYAKDDMVDVWDKYKGFFNSSKETK